MCAGALSDAGNNLRDITNVALQSSLKRHGEIEERK